MRTRKGIMQEARVPAIFYACFKGGQWVLLPGFVDRSGQDAFGGQQVEEFAGHIGGEAKHLTVLYPDMFAEWVPGKIKRRSS